MSTDRAYMVLPTTNISGLTASALSPTTVANLLTDEMSMVWRSATPTSATITFRTSGEPLDTIALIGTNLSAGDSWRVRCGDDASYAAYDSGVLPAWSGSKADWVSGKSILRLPASMTHTYWEIVITAPNAAAIGYIEAGRLVAGLALTHVGVDSDAELSILDQSEVTQGAGWQSFVNYGAVPVWKISFDQIADTDFMTSWFTFYGKCGNSRCVLFVPDDTTTAYKQNMAVFGTFTGENVGKHPLYDRWNMEVTLRARRA